MKLRPLLWYCLALFALALGCGGGGGGGTSGGSGGGTTSGAPAPGQYMEFLDGAGAWIDPLNLQVGTGGTAYIVNYDAMGNRSVLAGSNWTSSASGSVPIISTGFFNVFSSPGVYFNIQGTASIFGVPTVFTQAAFVPASRSTWVNGRVVQISIFTGQPTSVGIPFARVDFYNGGGTMIGSARTKQDGRFTAYVPTTAVEMMIDDDTLNADKFNRAIKYSDLVYTTTDTSCRIPIGPLSLGANSLPAVMGVYLVSGGPPPPPSACS